MNNRLFIYYFIRITLIDKVNLEEAYRYYLKYKKYEIIKQPFQKRSRILC